MKEPCKYSISIVSSNEISDWEDLRVKMRGPFYLSRKFADILIAEGCKPLFIKLMNLHGECSGIALAHLTEQWRRWPKNIIFRRFGLRTHPVVIDYNPDLLEFFSREIFALGKSLGVLGVDFQSEDAFLSPLGLSDLGMSPFDRIEFILKLQVNDDEYLARMGSRRRSYIRKMCKEGRLSVIEQNDEEGMVKLINFQDSSRKRRRKRGEDYHISSESAASFLTNTYIKSGNARLFFVLLDGESVAAVLLHCNNGHAYYTMAGCTPAGFESNAPTFLIWQIMRELRENGFTSLNLGGVSAEAVNKESLAHGLYQFKNSFGGIEVKCINWTMDFQGIRLKLFNLLS